MDKLNLTYTDALRYLEKAVAEKGEDYVYPSYQEGCEYFESVYGSNTGQPSCIVGHVLSYNGVTREDLGGGLNSSGVLTLNSQHPNGVLDVDDATEDLLVFAQRFQDNGMPWGQAVAEAQNPDRVNKYERLLNFQRTGDPDKP